MNRILVILIALFCITQLWAQQESPDLRRGNKEYKHENYTEAEINYRRGLEKNTTLLRDILIWEMHCFVRRSIQRHWSNTKKPKRY